MSTPQLCHHLKFDELSGSRMERKINVSIQRQMCLIWISTYLCYTVTTMDSQEPHACCDNIHLHGKVGVNIQLPYWTCFGGAKFDRGWDQPIDIW